LTSPHFTGSRCICFNSSTRFFVVQTLKCGDKRTGDKVQVMGAVSAMQTAGHDKAAVYLLTLTKK
jgi:hypothetical protein